MSQIFDDKAAKFPKLSFLINLMIKQTTLAHIGYLDGLRGMAALWVMVGHIVWEIPADLELDELSRRHFYTALGLSHASSGHCSRDSRTS